MAVRTYDRFFKRDRVRKIGTGYTGPGIVAGTVQWEGMVRYVVAHKIEGGDGWFFHIYAPIQLEPDDPKKGDV